MDASNPLGAVTQLGIMQKLTSGNMYFDVCLCMLLPLLLRYCEPLWEQIQAWFEAWFHPRSQAFVRTIEVQVRDGLRIGNTQDNMLLLDAVLLYIGSQPQLTTNFRVRSFLPHLH